MLSAMHGNPAHLEPASAPAGRSTRAALGRGVQTVAALAAVALMAGCTPGEPPADTSVATVETHQPPATTPDPADGTATAQELAELSARLDVPVQGVPRSALRDTYDESRGDRGHEALDIHAPRGTPVLAATDGRVLRLFDSTPGGLMIYATDASGRFILFYGHLAGYADGLHDGMPLRQGQVIGYVGTTGNAPDDTPHLHFGIMRGDTAVSWSSGVPTNPYPLLVPGRDSPAGGA